MLVSGMLWIKLLVSSWVLGFKKARAGLRAPEDKQASSAAVTDDAVEAADRAQRIVNNVRQGSAGKGGSDMSPCVWLAGGVC